MITVSSQVTALASSMAILLATRLVDRFLPVRRVRPAPPQERSARWRVLHVHRRRPRDTAPGTGRHRRRRPKPTDTPAPTPLKEDADV